MSNIPTTTNTTQTDVQSPNSLYERLLQSSHPVALLSYIILRAAPLAVYLFGMLFTNSYILFFILVILLLAADFWNTKNVAGRLLVGLRWWNETSEIGNTVWVFENADPNRYINPIDSNLFWILQYTIPALWSLLAFVALLKLHFISLILVVIALALSLTNTMAYTKCDKFGKANGIANSFFSNIFSKFNPLSAFT